MRLLVVTPTLGTSPWLDATVESVASTGAAHVLVTAPDRVAVLAARFSRPLVIGESATGMYAAINDGLRAVAEWDAFTYLNDDDLLLPAFSRLVEATAAQRGRPAVVYGGVRLVDANGRRLGGIPVSPAPWLNPWLYAQRIEPVYQHGTLVTRAAYEQLGGFDASFRLCGDSEFLARACQHGIPFTCGTRREVAAFRLRPGQLTKGREAMVAERARVDEKLGLIHRRRRLAQLGARWIFRLANLPIYAERIRRHGFVTFDELLAKAGQA